MAATTAAVIGGVASAASAAQSVSAMGASSGAPRWQRRNQRRIAGQAENVANTQMQVTPFNADQLRAQQAVRDSQGYLAEDMAGAQANSARYAQGIQEDDIRRFYNPYENDVIGAYMRDAEAMRGRTDLAVSDQARAAGAFGGDREAVYRAVTQGERERADLANIGGLRNAGWQNAMQAALGDRGYQISGNDQLARLIEQRRGARYQDTGALAASGAQQQQLAQRVSDLPLDRLRFRSDMNNPGTSMNTTPGQPGDPLAAGLAGYQGGYQNVRGAIDWYNNLRYGAGGAPVIGNPGAPTINAGPLVLPTPARV
jgi:hypothetical protein